MTSSTEECEDHNIKVFENKIKQKSKELDIIKEIDKLVQEYNQNPDNHYLLKLLKPLRRPWF